MSNKLLTFQLRCNDTHSTVHADVCAVPRIGETVTINKIRYLVESVNHDAVPYVALGSADTPKIIVFAVKS